MRVWPFSFALPVVGFAGYQALPDRGEVYAVPVEQAYQKLESMELEPGLRSMVAASDDLSLATSGVPNQAVIWTFKHDGDEVGEVRADLSAAGEGQTRVVVNFKLAERGELKHHAEFVNQQDLVSSYLRINLQERIAAKLENRKFDESRVSDAMSKYVMTHPQAMMKFGYDMSRAQHDPRLNGHDASLRWKAEHEQNSASQLTTSTEMQSNDELQGNPDASRPATDLSRYQ